MRAWADTSPSAERGMRIRAARRARSEKNVNPMLNHTTFATSTTMG